MNRKQRWLLGTGTVGAGLAALFLVPGQYARSADHFDPPLRTDPRPGFDPTPDRSADIADVFAFYDPNNVNVVNLAVTIHTFDATAASPLTSTYDRDLLYEVNVSTAAPASTPEHTIRFRFGPPSDGGTGFGVKFENLPGTSQPLICKVEDTTCQVTTAGGTVRAYVGLRDDPFFFDLTGFRDTIRTGTLSFNPTRDFFRGLNILTVVIQVPRANLGNPSNIGVWSTSARFGGQL
jgi:hypothetical protein